VILYSMCFFWGIGCSDSFDALVSGTRSITLFMAVTKKQGRPTTLTWLGGSTSLYSMFHPWRFHGDSSILGHCQLHNDVAECRWLTFVFFLAGE
jgi:hypothetical protein